MTMLRCLIARPLNDVKVLKTARRAFRGEV